MNRSEGSLVFPVLFHTFWRTIYGYLLVLAALVVFPLVPALRDYGAGWYWFLVPALVLHGLYVLSVLNDPVRLRKMRERRAPREQMKLDATRQPYLADLENRREIINRRVGQLVELPSLSADMAGMISELDRLVPELETLLQRNQRLESDIKRLESSRAARPSQESLRELKDLYSRQWDVIKRVTGEVATFDANLAIVINQFDAERDSENLDLQIKEWSGNLEVWKDSIRQVYG